MDKKGFAPRLFVSVAVVIIIFVFVFLPLLTNITGAGGYRRAMDVTKTAIENICKKNVEREGLPTTIPLQDSSGTTFGGKEYNHIIIQNGLVLFCTEGSDGAGCANNRRIKDKIPLSCASDIDVQTTTIDPVSEDRDPIILTRVENGFLTITCVDSTCDAT